MGESSFRDKGKTRLSATLSVSNRLLCPQLEMHPFCRRALLELDAWPARLHIEVHTDMDLLRRVMETLA